MSLLIFKEFIHEGICKLVLIYVYCCSKYIHGVALEMASDLFLSHCIYEKRTLETTTKLCLTWHFITTRKKINNGWVLFFLKVKKHYWYIKNNIIFLKFEACIKCSIGYIGELFHLNEFLKKEN